MKYTGKLAVVVRAIGVMNTGNVAIAISRVVSIDIVDGVVLGVINDSDMAGSVALENYDVTALEVRDSYGDKSITQLLVGYRTCNRRYRPNLFFKKQRFLRYFLSILGTDGSEALSISNKTLNR